MRLTKPFWSKIALLVIVYFCWLILLQARPSLPPSGSEAAFGALALGDEDTPGMIELTAPPPPPKHKASILPWIIGGVVVVAVVGVGGYFVLKAKQKKVAAFTIRSVPDPIPYSSDSSGVHYWYFRHEVSETGGAGANLLQWYSDMYDDAGKFMGHQDFTMQNFKDWFTDCGGAGVRIEANSIRCCDSFWYGSSDNEKGWKAEETMIFEDDSGNRITAVGVFRLLPIPGSASSSLGSTRKSRGVSASGGMGKIVDWE